MIDFTFDIANEYLDKLKLSKKELIELESIYKKEDAERQERRGKVDQNLLAGSLPMPIPKVDNGFGCNHQWDGKVVRTFIDKDGDAQIIYDDMEVDWDEIFKLGKSIGSSVTCSKCGIPFPTPSFPNEQIDPEILEDNVALIPILSHKEYLKQRKKDPKIVQKIYRLAEKYGKDKRLYYSNNHYHQMVFIVAVHNLIEKTLSDSISSFELARKITEEHKELIEGNNFEPYKHTVYPKVVMDEFERQVVELKKDYSWHKDEEGLGTTFMIAYHYGQEIPEEAINIPMSLLEKLFRLKYFYYFFMTYTIIPFLIQEVLMLIIGLTHLKADGILIRESINQYKEWVEKNYVKYITLMLFIASIIWMWLLK